MRFWETAQLILMVARRELTSILRGRAERFLFIWTSLFLLPLITLAFLTIFLVVRTTDILTPVQLAVSSEQMRIPQTARLVEELKSFPEIVVQIAPDPLDSLLHNECDAVIEREDDGTTFKVTSRDYSVERVVSRAVEAARHQSMQKLIKKSSFETVYPYYVSTMTLDQYKLSSDTVRQGVIALYMMAYLYAVLWLVPAIDVVRFDFLHNNMYANLCLPVPMRIVTGGKLLSGIVITLIPTILSGIAFVFSMLVAFVVVLDYYAGGIIGGGVTFADFRIPALQVPSLELLLLPIVVVLAIAFLHSWLMVVVIFFQGQRLSFLASTLSLFALAQAAVVWGMVLPSTWVWPCFVPFFGLASIVHQLIDKHFSWLGLLGAVVATVIATAGLVVIAGRFYRLESWKSRLSPRRASA